MNSHQNPSRHRVGFLVLVAVFSLLCLLFETAGAAPRLGACVGSLRIGNTHVASDPLHRNPAGVCVAPRSS